MKLTMVEQQVMFENPEIPNHALLTGPIAEGDEFAAELVFAIGELRTEAEKQLGPVKDEQVFYRLFRKDE